MERLLAIETTGLGMGVSLYAFDRAGAGGRLIGSVSSSRPRRASELLIPAVARLLQKTGVRRKQLTCVAVDVGPGSFTGVRIGVTAARTLAQALALPLIGVSSLRVMAAAAARRCGSHAALLGVVRPALAGEVYVAAYTVSKQRITEEVLAPRWSALGRCQEDVMKVQGALPLFLAGEVVPGLQEVFTRAGSQMRWLSGVGEPRSAHLAAEAARMVRAAPRGAKFSYDAVTPVYLQPSWAERRSAGRG